MVHERIWTFANSLGAHRLSLLANAPSYEKLVREIASQMRILCCHRESCRDSSAFSRAVSCVEIDPDLFDLFYNSSFGYRAHFYDSPNQGDWANDQLFDATLESLVKAAGPEFEGKSIDAAESFRMPSRKAWLAEAERGRCIHCNGEWSEPSSGEPEIYNGRWELVSDIRGRKAPRFRKLRLFGGFLDASFSEYIADRKRLRAFDIHQTGWT
jgi:hypothetical protein